MHVYDLRGKNLLSFLNKKLRRETVLEFLEKIIHKEIEVVGFLFLLCLAEESMLHNIVLDTIVA